MYIGEEIDKVTFQRISIVYLITDETSDTYMLLLIPSVATRSTAAVVQDFGPASVFSNLMSQVKL